MEITSQFQLLVGRFGRGNVYDLAGIWSPLSSETWKAAAL